MSLKKILNAFLLIMLPTTLLAQMNISFPMEKAVFQRNSVNQGTIYIAGSYTNTSVNTIEAKLTPINGGTFIDWTTIQNSPQKGNYYGSLTAQAGWYFLEVRSKAGGNVIESASLGHVGVGEVFIIAGQSNAQGLPNYGSVGANDERVVNHNYDGLYDGQPAEQATSCSVKNPPYPTLSTIIANTTMSKYGQSAWCYGKLGDLLAGKLGVPVAFYNAGASGSSSQNWRESADGLATMHQSTGQTYCGVAGSPYSVLKISLHYYASLFGIRAVLWHQGESDHGTNPDTYESNINYTIAKSRSDFGSTVPWVISQATYSPYSSPAGSDYTILAAQHNIASNGTQTFYGPNTDLIAPPDYPRDAQGGDGLHFFGSSQIELANRWNAALDPNFFNNSTPITAKPLPQVQISCNGGSQLVLTAPAGYTAYKWVNGDDWIENAGVSTNQSITQSSGTYRCYLTDNLGNVTVTQAFTVQNIAAYCTTCTQPNITNTVINQATCPGSGTTPNNDASVTLTVSSGDRYTTTGSNYAGATPLAGGNTATVTNLTQGTSITFKIFNGNDNCYTQTTVNIPTKTCACTQPVISNTVTNPATCPPSGITPNSDANVTLTVSGGDRYTTSGSNYAGATPLAGGNTASANNLTQGTSVTFKIFNGNDNCYTQTTVNIPTKICSCTGVTYLSDLTPASAVNANEFPIFIKDKSYANQTLTLKGTTFAKGLGDQSNSTTIYNINGLFGRFITTIGLDDEITASSCNNNGGSVVFSIYKDNVLAYQSPIMTPASQPIQLNLNVAGANQLKITLADAGDNTYCDHGDWAGARLHCIDNTPPSNPSNLVVSQVATKCAQIAWTGSTDNMEVWKYLIYSNNILVDSVIAPTTTYNFSNLTAGSSYNITVKAKDYSGNISQFGATGTISTISNISVSASISTINAGQSTVLTATGCNSGSVSWSNGQSGTAQTVSPTQTTTYKATCRTNNCNSDSVAVQITVLICQPTYAISTAINNVTTYTLTYPASQTITANSQITNSKITYQAAKSVTLQPGFKADQTDVFSAIIANCNFVCNVSPPSVSKTSISQCSLTLQATGCAGTINWSNGSGTIAQSGTSITVNTTTPNTYSATCTVGSCTSTASNSVSTISAGWSNMDIGTPPVAGCSGFDGTNLVVRGTGTILSGSDQCQYVFKSFSGDVSIITKIAAQTGAAGANIRSGIMVRTSNQVDAPFFEVILQNNTSDRVVAKAGRNIQGDGAALYGYNGVGASDVVWLKFDKVGNTITASYRLNTDVNWIIIANNTSGSTTLTFGGTYQIGFNAYNDNYSTNNLVNQTTFSNVTINGNPF